MKCLPEMKIFVGGIGIGTTEDDVKKYFDQFGKVDRYKKCSIYYTSYKVSQKKLNQNK